jgi:hypothetical protein
VSLLHAGYYISPGKEKSRTWVYPPDKFYALGKQNPLAAQGHTTRLEDSFCQLAQAHARNIPRLSHTLSFGLPKLKNTLGIRESVHGIIQGVKNEEMVAPSGEPIRGFYILSNLIAYLCFPYSQYRCIVHAAVVYRASDGFVDSPGSLLWHRYLHREPYGV